MTIEISWFQSVPMSNAPPHDAPHTAMIAPSLAHEHEVEFLVATPA